MLGLTKGIVRLWLHQPQASICGKTAPWHPCTHTLKYTRAHTHIHSWPQERVSAAKQKSPSFKLNHHLPSTMGSAWPWGAPQLPPGTATKAAMKNTYWEAFLLMNSRLLAAKSRDGHSLSLTHSHSETRTRTVP